MQETLIEAFAMITRGLEPVVSYLDIEASKAERVRSD